MKIVITGNMGYVGPEVVRQLRVNYPRATLVGVDLGCFAHCLASEEPLPECHTDLQYFRDIRSVEEEIFRDADAVVHLAAVSNDPMSKSFEEATFAINHQGTIWVAQQAKRARVRMFAFASSCSVYGYAEDGSRTETSPVNPLTAYAKSKVMAENDLRSMADDSFTITCLRFATACGMSERLRLDLVLNDFVAGAVVLGKINVLSDGSPWRPLINVKDMARALSWAITRDNKSGHYLVVNVGSNEWNYQIRDLAHAVANVIPGVEISINESAPPDKRSYRVGYDLFKELAPHHQAETSLHSTIVGLKKGLDDMKFDDRNYRDSRFIRLNVLRGLRARGLLTANLRFAFKNENGKIIQ